MFNILIVDDEENARLGLSRLLSAEGYRVATAENGVEALKYLSIHLVDLVITDLHMPEMNGLTFIHELNNRFPRPGVIMLTAYEGGNSYCDMISPGTCVYLSKPVKLTLLKGLIKQTFFCRDDEQIKTDFKNSALL